MIFPSFHPQLLKAQGWALAGRLTNRRLYETVHLAFMQGRDIAEGSAMKKRAPGCLGYINKPLEGVTYNWVSMVYREDNYHLGYISGCLGFKGDYTVNH